MIQDKKKYFAWLKKEIDGSFGRTRAKVFLFGSSVSRERFGDIDVGVMGEIPEAKLRELKERFVESTFPYFVDVINFNSVSARFREAVFSNPIVWITK